MEIAILVQRVLQEKIHEKTQGIDIGGTRKTNKTKVATVAMMDDLTAIQRSKTEMDKAMRILTRWCEITGAEVTNAKSQYVGWTTTANKDPTSKATEEEDERRKEEKETLEIGRGKRRREIKEGTEIETLWITVSVKNEAEDLNKAIEEAKERMEKIMDLKEETPPETIVRIVRITVIPIFTEK